MTTKLGRVVTYSGRNPPSKSRDLLTTWHVTNEKNRYLHFHNSYGHQTWQSGNLWLKDPTHCLKGLLITWSRDKCKILYLDFYNTYDHQTWQGGNLRWQDPNFKVTWPFDDVDTWQMKNLHFHNIYGHQTWQSGNLRLEDPAH